MNTSVKHSPFQMYFNRVLRFLVIIIFFFFVCFNATFNNISAISWRPILVVEEAGENHRPWASNW